MLPNVIHIFTLIDFLASSSKRNNNTLLWPYPHCCWWYIPIYAQKGQQLKGCTIIIMYHWSYRQICLTELIGNIFFVPIRAAHQQQGGNLFFHSGAVLGILIPVRSISALKFARKLFFFYF